MKKTKEIINEEKRFLRLCGPSYRDLIRKKKPMTMNDFNRISYLVATLGLTEYFIYFVMHMFPDLFTQSCKEAEQRYFQYSLLNSYKDNLYAELDTHQRWLQEFCEQMLLLSQRKKYREQFTLVD